MTTYFDLVTLDSPAPNGLAAFWCAALHLVEHEREDGDRWLVLSDARGTRRIGIQRGPSAVGSIHLDLACAPAAFDAEVARLRSLGAVLLQPVRREPYGPIANFADPDGNRFDLCGYT